MRTTSERRAISRLTRSSERLLTACPSRRAPSALAYRHPTAEARARAVLTQLRSAQSGERRARATGRRPGTGLPGGGDVPRRSCRLLTSSGIETRGCSREMAAGRFSSAGRTDKENGTARSPPGGPAPSSHRPREGAAADAGSTLSAPSDADPSGSLPVAVRIGFFSFWDGPPLRERPAARRAAGTGHDLPGPPALAPRVRMLRAVAALVEVERRRDRDRVAAALQLLVVPFQPEVGQARELAPPPGLRRGHA